MYVYILRSKKDGSYYIGSTKNIQERFLSHNKGLNASTRFKTPWFLARVEEYSSSILAIKREKFLESGRGRKVINSLCSL